MDLLAALTWDERDLERLLGQPESFRLEFKSGALFRHSWEKGIETALAVATKA